MCLLLSAGMLSSFAAYPAASAAELAPPTIAESIVTADMSGSCGSNTTWTLSGGNLTITGSGDMTNWELVTYVPWYKNMSEIRNVVISSGVTNIGRAAFLGATNLTSVTIPDTVTTISANAFEKTALSSVTIPASVEVIGLGSFASCPNLREVKIYNAQCRIITISETINNSGKGNFSGTIYGAEGSYAQTYASTSNYKFSVLHDAPKTTTTTTTTTTTKATTTTTKATTTTQPQYEPILYGDTNLDKKVDISDAVLIMQALSNPSVYGLTGSSPTHLTEKGRDNADVSTRGDGMTNMDALAIQKYALELISSLPC